MLSKTILALALTAAVQAAVSPLTPATINEGQQLNIQWTPDTTNTWTNVSIALMSGSNWEMNVVAPITDGVDGTKSPGSFEWTVPDVSPNSGIYFLQFTNNGINPTWTTRFAIASSSGETTQPTEQTQPDGQSIAWGTGALAGTTPAGPSSAAMSSGMSMSGASSSAAAQSSASSSAMSSAASSMASSSMSSRSSADSSASSFQAASSASVRSSTSATPSVVPASSAGQLQVAGMGIIVAFAVGLLAI